MEQAKAAKKPSTKANPAQKIKEGYINYVLEHGAKPVSIFKFVKDLKVKEDLFYDHTTLSRTSKKRFGLTSFKVRSPL